MNVVVTGGAGYLGSVLVPKLVARGHHVRVVDLGYFGLGHLKMLAPAIDLRREDLRAVVHDAAFGRDLLRDADCVIHLAAISNDPSAELHPELTEEVNVGATLRLAEIAREQGVRFLFSSSCSIYGEAEGEIDEGGSVHPLTVYARSKVAAEEGLSRMADASWTPIVLRNGTLFGYSTRMRFDLVVNIFSLHAALYRESGSSVTGSSGGPSCTSPTARGRSSISWSTCRRRTPATTSRTRICASSTWSACSSR